MLGLPSIVAQVDIANQLTSNAGAFALDLVKGLLFLIIGYFVAIFVSGLVKGLLRRTDIDNRVASWLSSGRVGGQSPTYPIERWAGKIVFWIIFLFAVVAFLDALKLQTVSQPLNTFLAQITNFTPQLLAAAVLLGVAWLVATVVKFLVTRGLGSLQLEEKLGQGLGDSSQERIALSETIGNALYWFVFLLFLPSLLGVLKLEGTLQPVQNLLDNILGALPRIFEAAIIGVVGWFIAKIVRQIVTNLLSATGVDRVGENFGLSRATGKQSLSWVLGTVVYVLILIPVAIAALNALRIQAISQPAIEMLNQVLNIIPKLFAAGVIVAIAYAIGKYVAELVTNILSGIGFDNVFQWLGIPSPAGRDNLTSSRPLSSESEQPTILQSGAVVGQKTPSEWVGTIAWTAIILIAVLAAVDILGIQTLQRVVSVVLVIAGQVAIGTLVFAVGLILANFAYNLIAASGSRQAKILGQTARIAIIALVAAMALQQMGVATSIVNLAFGLLLGSIAVAIAVAFGLGGREIAAEQVREWLEGWKGGRS
jgi:Conserved TM helix